MQASSLLGGLVLDEEVWILLVHWCKVQLISGGAGYEKKIERTFRHAGSGSYFLVDEIVAHDLFQH